jgi:hypothetical protein
MLNKRPTIQASIWEMFIAQAAMMDAIVPA